MSSIPLSNLESVLTSTNKAKGLPNEHYVSEAVFEEEKKAILFNNWSAIGTGKDIPNPGDVIANDLRWYAFDVGSQLKWRY